MLSDQQRKIVILAGSGRSGTTWLGSILDSYEHCEYFYEISHFPDLSFEKPDLLQIKYPLSHAVTNPPNWLRKLERALLIKARKSGIKPASADRALRINQPYGFSKDAVDTFLFKIVILLSFALDMKELQERLGNRLKVVHLIRNPYSQFASERLQHFKQPDKSREHFRNRVEFIITQEALTDYHPLARRYLDADWLEHMAVLWWISNDFMVKQASAKVRCVVYEEFCRHPVEQAQQLFEFLDWRPSDQTWRHLEKTTGVSNSDPGKWSIIKNAEESMNKWRKELTLEEYRRVSDLLSDCPLLEFWSSEELAFNPILHRTAIDSA